MAPAAATGSANARHPVVHLHRPDVMAYVHQSAGAYAEPRQDPAADEHRSAWQ
jgi:hypothetical protein